MTNVLRIKPSATRKSDFNSLCKSVIRVTDKYESEKLLVKQTLARMALAFEVSNQDEAPELISAESKLIREKRELLSRQVSHIASLTNSYTISDKAEVKQAANKLHALTSRVFKRFINQTNASKLMRTQQFINDVSADLNLQAAIATLKLEDELDAITLTFADLLEANDKLIAYRSKKQIGKGEKKEAIYTLMTRLFDAIESACLEHPEMNFEAMIEDLNQLIRPLNITSMSRQTRNAGKKKAEDTKQTKVAEAIEAANETKILWDGNNPITSQN